ncbi:mucin-associated surface protein (MASP), putative [Trypanosoma cruzi]|nr:mucin-associated surface protein (MASP), putative [Trypanosoma cruzi]
MMMTMTGRVLLVCALCVLCCGVCGSERAEATLDSPDKTPENDPQKEKVTVGVAAGVDQNGKQKVTQVPAAPTGSELPVGVPRPSQAQQPGGGASEMAIATMDNQDQREEGKNEKMEEEAKQKEQEKQQGEEDEGEEDDEEEEEEEEEEDLRSKSDSLEPEAEVISEEETQEALENAIIQAPTEISGGPNSNEEIQTATTQVNGESSREALGDVKQSEEVQGEKVSNDNSQTKSVVSIAANQQNEKSAGHGESGPPSPTANGDAANNDFDKSIEDGISDSDPAADGAGTAEGKQNENKDANPKETPVTAAAMKNITATTGDSDGSTAFSHTTSPLLLLLLVVACAAAAAVVAA